MKRKVSHKYIFGVLTTLACYAFVYVSIVRCMSSRPEARAGYAYHRYDIPDPITVQTQNYTANASRAPAHAAHNYSHQNSAVPANVSTMHITATSAQNVVDRPLDVPESTARRSIIMAFPMSTELDIVHAKLDLLYEHIDVMILCECKFALNGSPKVLHYDAHKNEPRFAKYHRKLVHLIDEKNPHKTGSALGWEQLERPKIVLGTYILQNAHKWHPDSIVFMADMDEFPAVDTLLWARDHVQQGQTAVFDTRYFLYNFRWLIAPVSRAQMTARLLVDETRFWTHRNTAGSGPFAQQLISPPDTIHPGYHCGYCQTSDLNVLKLRYSNVIDGPPFLTEYFWDVEIFNKLRSCGVSPRCVKLTPVHEAGHAFSLYNYSNGAQTDTCGVVHISQTNWRTVNPELQECPHLQWNIST